MTALPLECQSAFDAAVELLRHPMVGDALMKLTVDNMIVHTRTSAILRVCAYHEMPWVGELCEHIKDHDRERDEPASSRKRKEPERSHGGVPSIKRKGDHLTPKGWWDYVFIYSFFTAQLGL